jgi:hypothetical protein
MLSILNGLPDIYMHPLKYIFEYRRLQHKPNTLWLEFGVCTGKSINYISSFTKGTVYGFDSFEGLPEDWRNGFPKGAFDMSGNLPVVNSNVELIKGWFNETLDDFVEFIVYSQNKVSFIHMDADLYSSTKYILDKLKAHLDKDCIIVFDELLNYDGFDNDKGELKALYEFINENNVTYSWIGMNGIPLGMSGRIREVAAIMIHSVN